VHIEPRVPRTPIAASVIEIEQVETPMIQLTHLRLLSRIFMDDMLHSGYRVFAFCNIVGVVCAAGDASGIINAHVQSTGGLLPSNISAIIL
jgi:hypothetical protein